MVIIATMMIITLMKLHISREDSRQKQRGEE